MQVLFTFQNALLSSGILEALARRSRINQEFTKYHKCGGIGAVNTRLAGLQLEAISKSSVEG
jgi:hypothetical protein